MNSREIIDELIMLDDIKFVTEPFEIWEALDPNDNIIGEVKTTWEYYSFRAQIKTNVHKSGYKLRKKDEPIKILIFDEYGSIERESRRLICDDFDYWLNVRC